jgi:hypothetical protein
MMTRHNVINLTNAEAEDCVREVKRRIITETHDDLPMLQQASTALDDIFDIIWPIRQNINMRCYYDKT